MNGLLRCILNSLQLALALHPDKNGAPNADEAFKSEPYPTIVSNVTELTYICSGIQGIPGIIRPVLIHRNNLSKKTDDDIASNSDPQKRAAHDRHGSDPEDRTAGMAPGRGFATATSPFGGGGGEMSPEDLFNMFFGGGGMGGFADGGLGGGGPSTLFYSNNLNSIFLLIIILRSIHRIIWPWWFPYNACPTQSWCRRCTRHTSLNVYLTPPSHNPLRIHSSLRPPQSLLRTIHSRPAFLIRCGPQIQY